MAKTKKLYYKIGEACKQLDIQPYVLRYWETEFPLLAPSKSTSGQRVYSEQDLRVIQRIKELLYEEGYTIAGAKKKLDKGDLSSLAEVRELPLPDAGAGEGDRAASERASKTKPASRNDGAGKSKIKSIADLKKLGRTIKTAGTGKGATSYVVSQIAGNILGLKLKLVTGYKGSSGMSIAVIRGDTDIGFFAYRSYSKFAKSGDLRAIAALDEKGAIKLGKPGLSKLRIHRLVAAPPGLPADIKKTLEDALFASINDAGFKKWAKKARRPLAALKGKASEKLIDELVTFYTGHKDKFK